jgi:hypothetical protein
VERDDRGGDGDEHAEHREDQDRRARGLAAARIDECPPVGEPAIRSRARDCDAVCMAGHAVNAEPPDRGLEAGQLARVDRRLQRESRVIACDDGVLGGSAGPLAERLADLARCGYTVSVWCRAVGAGRPVVALGERARRRPRCIGDDVLEQRRAAA